MSEDGSVIMRNILDCDRSNALLAHIHSTHGEPFPMGGPL